MLIHSEISEVKIVHNDSQTNALLREGWQLIDEFSYDGIVSFVLVNEFDPRYDFQAMYTGEATI